MRNQMQPDYSAQRDTSTFTETHLRELQSSQETTS